MLEGILGFFDERVFGPRRRDLPERDLASFDGEPERIRQRQMRSLRRAIDKLDLAQTRLVLTSQTMIPKGSSSGGSESACPN